MTGSITAIIFDLGNVLIRWDPYNLFLKYFSNDAQAVDRFFTEVHFFEWNLRIDKGLPYTQALAEFTVQYPQYAHLFHAYYEKEWEEAVPGPIPEVVALLPRLKAAGYRLCGLSNWSADKFILTRQKYPFFDLFEQFIVSGEVKLTKPDPAIFRLLLEKMKLSPQECLLIDDSPKNIETAISLGFGAILFTGPEQLEAELHRLKVL